MWKAEQTVVSTNRNGPMNVPNLQKLVILYLTLHPPLTFFFFFFFFFVQLEFGSVDCLKLGVR